MEKLVVLATKAPSSPAKHDDDFVDRLNNRYTVGILVVFTVAISLVQQGKPMTCWTPADFTKPHIKYTESYCWVKNTYYLSLNDEIPKSHQHNRRDMITYYQWIPFILLTQALFFFLPSQVWHGLNQRGGVDADNILVYASTLEHAKKFDNREEVMQLMVNQIDRFLGTRIKETSGWKLGFRNVFNKICCGCCGKRLGSYLLVLYLLTKLLYIANIIGQLFWLGRVFRTRFVTFGIDYIREAMAGRPWIDDTNFPKVTYCDLLVRRLGNVQRHTIQCVLPLNLYIEIMFVFLWFWMMFLAVVTCVNFVVWTTRAVFISDRFMFIMNHLTIGDRVDSNFDTKLAKEFFVNYLRQDGCFLLRLMAHNTNNITVTEITCALWDNWLGKGRLKGKGHRDREFVNNVNENTLKRKGN